MRVHVHTRFCLLCVLTFLYHQPSHCHGDGHRRQHHGHRHASHAHSDLQISEAPYVTRASPSAESALPDGEPLEEEQQFYIRQLFRRYGQKGRLDFQGFQSMLVSLGLGEVKVVDVAHDDLGHDHVAHLDVLDVQESLHSHGKAHGRSHAHHSPSAHHPHTESGPTRCSQSTASVTPPGTSGERPHKHHGDHDHNHDHHHEHPHGAEHGHHHDHAEDDDDGGDGGHHSERALIGAALPPASGERPSSAPVDLRSSPAPANAKSKRPRKPGRVRGQNKTLSPTAALSENHDHRNGVDHGHGHSHKDKREAPGGPDGATVPGPIFSAHASGLTHQHEECLNLTQLLHHYGLSPDSLISPSQFTYLCPALLYQIDSRLCIRHYHQKDVEQEALDNVSSVWTWVWGFVSITIISLLSLLGVVLVPILNQSCFKFLLTFLVALAVGTLSGDALLHLLPHAQGQHDHGDDGDGGHAVDLASDFDGVWKGLTALAGIYLLFIFEHCIGMFKHYKDQRAAKKASEEGKIGRKLSDHKLNRRSDAEWVHLKALGDDLDGSTVSCDGEHNDTQLTELRALEDSPADKTAAKAAGGHKAAAQGGRGHGHGHSHGGNCHSDQEMKDAGIASIAWMVIMGDGMHNFSDGLAIGAAFSANLTGGISTSVAVFCHELPHELGDFAVLLKAGMSVKQAIVYNVLSALMAYVGMLIGTSVGQYTHNVTSWIFAITAGMFLYVALVDMLPELLHGDSEEHKRCQLGHFVLQNLGLLTGFGIMLLIAIFEDRIVFDFGF